MSIFPVRLDRIRPFLVLAICVSTNLWGAIDSQEDMERVFDSFYRIGLNTETIYAAGGFELRKDAMVFQFQEGDFFLMNPLEGEITGAYFIGKGRAKMTPPTAMERKQLAQNTGSENLNAGFTEMFIRFNDDTGNRIQKLPKGETGQLPMTLDKISARFKNRNKAVYSLQSIGSNKVALEMDYLEGRFTGMANRDFFFSQILIDDFGWLTYYFSNLNRREIFLGGFEKIGSQWRTYTWCYFHKQMDYDDTGHYVANLTEDSKDILDILHYDMKVSIKNLETVEIDADIQIVPLRGTLTAIRLDLINTLDSSNWESTFLPAKVLQISGPAGKPLQYLHKRNQILILLPEPVPPEKKFTFNAKVREKTIQQLTKESFSLLNTFPWFPQYGYLGGRATFKWEVRVPKPYKPTGSGHMIKEWEEKDFNCALWESKIPVQFASLIFGRFQKEISNFKNAKTNNTVRLSVHSFPVMTYTITDPVILAQLGSSTPETVELRVPGSKMGDILSESEQILTLFEDIYGPFLFDELDIAQMAPQYNFAQAPPGLVQLLGTAFLSQSDPLLANSTGRSDFLHDFLSHEIAHQWWGHMIGWYEDQDAWLSESFAEYSAGIFVKQLKGERRFQQKIKEWRQWANVADSAGPIATANRIGGDTAGRDRFFLLYGKGPLVVHMLRKQIGDDQFRKAMTAVMERYRNQNIKTEHLRMEIERVVGYKMDWFFDQWFRDTGIPEIHVKYQVTPASGGGYLLEGTVSQDPATFKKFFSLPMRIYFSKGRIANQVVRIGQPQQTFKFKLPENPKKVTVDEDNDLLAEIIVDK